MPAGDDRVLCVSLHDVAPATLQDCAETLRFLDTLRIGPVALLVVPNFHGCGRVDRDERFCEFLRSRERRGDEIVLHGYWHQDAGRTYCSLRDRFERRIGTAGEGEFSGLNEDTARTRLLRGLAVMRTAGWQPDGFVAPAWLMSAGTRTSLDSLPFTYCSTRDTIIPLLRDGDISAPSLVVSTRSALRRSLSPAWNQMRLWRRMEAPVLRAALHPRDVRYASIAALWRNLFGQLPGRPILTEGQVVARAACASSQPRPTYPRTGVPSAPTSAC